MILIDIQKAFDAVNHDILLRKIEFRGFSEKKKKVYIKNTFSGPGNLPCWVPQRSILLPLLFLLYINYIDCELLLHADDTSLKF